MRITAGGTYENLLVISPDSDSAAIEVETTDSVVIRHVRGSGPGNFVHAQGGSDVTIENSLYLATTPSRDNVRPGRSRTPTLTRRPPARQGASSLTGTVALSLPYDTAEQTVYDEFEAMLASANVTGRPNFLHLTFVHDR